MEIKINKEIKAYKENLFFGLSTRQFFCSLLTVIIAMFLYVKLQHLVGKEYASWVCLLAAAPFAGLGFFSYHGMSAEKAAWAFLKSEVFYAGPRIFANENYYHKMVQPEKTTLFKRRKKKMESEHV